PGELLVGQPDRDGPVDDADPRGDRPARADRGVHPLDALAVLGNGEPLADHAGLERDHAVAQLPCHADLVGDPERATHRDALDGQVSALDATSAPAWHARRSAASGCSPRASAASNTPSNASPAPVASTSAMGSMLSSTSVPSNDMTAPFSPSFTHATR